MVVSEYYNGSIVCVPCEQEDGLLSGHVIKPGMETGNEMKWNETKSTFSAVVDIHFAIYYNLNNNSTCFHRLKGSMRIRMVPAICSSV